MTGGYQIIDFKGLELAESPTIKGIYDSLKGNNRAVMVTGIVADGKEYDGFYTNFIVDGTDFTAVFGFKAYEETGTKHLNFKQLRVKDTDEIILENYTI